MNQVLTWLSGGDLRSDGMANEVAEFVLQNPDAFEDLYAGLSETDDVVRGRSTDALEKVTRKRPDLTVEYLPQLINLSEVEKVPMVKMHLAMIFGHLAVYPDLAGQLLEALLYLLQDESVFTRSWAIVSLCILARKFPRECQTVIEAIVPLQTDQSIAIRTKARKAIDLLSDPRAEFPAGWIKSEHLKGI